MNLIHNYEDIFNSLIRAHKDLTPKLLWPIFRSFLKFGQASLVRVLMLNF